MGTGIILLGHGSHISAETAGIVWEQVDHLRALGVADEITAAFWKEQPSFHEVLASLLAEDITLIPLFTAQGYFTRTVIPAEMKLNERPLRYAPPFGSHPALGELLQSRVEDALKTYQLSSQNTAVALIGHGTRRNPESRTLTEAQAGVLREQGLVGEVVAAYLDDIPSIPDIYTMTSQKNLVVIPYFLALGSHTTIDVPTELGLEQGQTVGEIQGRKVYYALPLGMTDTLTEIILDLARSADAPLKAAKQDSPWSNFPRAGADKFNELAHKGLKWGEVWFSAERVCHLDDQHEADLKILQTPAELRDFLRLNPFRPLHSARNLPRGWQIAHPPDLAAVAETIYPASLAKNQLVSLHDLAERQTGVYRRVGHFTSEQIAHLVHDICSGCVKNPTWWTGESGEMLCAEACNWWLSHAWKQVDG